jgi:phospholipid/cholesterol/gamma-HCH transport system substrate-binding protein
MDIEARERRELQKKQLLVGSLLGASLALACLFAYWMGVFSFGPMRELRVRYNFAGGIDRGSPVRLAGIRVGRVSDMHFTGEPDGQIELVLSIDRPAFGSITQDSRFYINLAGLIGERYVEVVPGSESPAKPGAVLRGEDPPRVDQLLSQGYGIFGDLRGFFDENKGDLQQMLQSLSELTKNLNTLVANATPEQRRQLNTILRNFSDLSIDLKQATSTINRGLGHIEANGGERSWKSVAELLNKVNRLDVNDFRRLMLEDGVKVNFSSKKIEERLAEEAKQ